MRRDNRAAMVTALVVAWGGTALLISPAARVLGAPERLSTALLGQLVLWLLFGAVVAILRYWERASLASIWLHVRWRMRRSTR